jgi:hypothetical protein
MTTTLVGIAGKKMMKHRLLTSVAVAGLMSFAATTWASEFANNNAGSAITQARSADATSAGGNAANDGAATGDGNALGYDTDQNAVADQKSTAVEIDDTVDYGSAVNVGNGNEGAAAYDSGAAATGSSAAVVTENSVEDGSAHVIGDGNLSAAAHDGGAAVGANGTAVGISEVNVNAEDATIGFGEGNVVSAAHLEETTTVSAHIAEEGGGITLGKGGAFFEFKKDADLAGVVAYGPNAEITTGNINNQTLGTLSGANLVAANTGLANQGDSIGIAANNSF